VLGPGTAEDGSWRRAVHLSLIHRTESRAKSFWTGKEWARTVDPAVGTPAYPRNGL
jgi:hypothetical protein